MRVCVSEELQGSLGEGFRGALCETEIEGQNMIFFWQTSSEV